MCGTGPLGGTFRAHFRREEIRSPKCARICPLSEPVLDIFRLGKGAGAAGAETTRVQVALAAYPGVSANECEAFTLVFERLADTEILGVGEHLGRVDGPGGGTTVDRHYDEVLDPDVVLVREGSAAHALRRMSRCAGGCMPLHHGVVGWRPSPTGTVVVAAAGLLDEREAATHWLAGDLLLNLQAEKQFGYRRDELLGQRVTNIVPHGFAERLIADGTRTAAEALAQQIGTGIELSARRKDGSEFPIEIMLSPLESAEGILVIAAIRDISVRKAAEEHLAQMESRYRGLLEAAPDAMVVVDTDGEIVLLNVQAEKQFGYHRDELLGQQVKNIIPEGFAERLIADALRSAEVALAQQIGTGIELSGRRKDGTEFPIEIMLSPLAGAEGILVTAAIRDISRRKAAEAQLLEKVEELKRSNEELGQFAYIASHDLQEPLRMVASYTQLLSKRYKGRLDSDADEFIAFAVDGASRMQRLIQDLLAYSRVGTKGKELIETSSERSLEQALVNLRGSIEESGAVVTHDALPGVLADETQLVQLFQNLVGNAIKYQGPGVPRVHVSAVRDGDQKWMFSVRDNGLGIDPQYFDRIFGMFQRLHKREEFAGTGIGLAICRKIAERHGSNITVESQPGQGSTFRFSLAGSEGVAECSSRSGMRRDVLLVEDSPGDVRLTQEVFRDANMSAHLPNMAIHLHVASDGVEAMAFLRREGAHEQAPRPDLILLDLNLPRMDGREVLAHIKGDHNLRTIPTVILTTSDAEADIVKSYQLQANCYLSKPVQLDAFENLVREHQRLLVDKVKLPQKSAID